MANKITQVSLANNLPQFHGNSEENVNYFLEQVDNVANLEKWSEDRKFLIIKLNLKGKAQQFIANDSYASKAKNSEELKKCLKHKYQKKESFADNYNKFAAIVQIPNQSINELAELVDTVGDRYLGITEDSTPDLCNLAKKTKLNKFLDALRSDIKLEVRKQNPTTFEKAIEIAKNIECALSDPTCQVNHSFSTEIDTVLQNQLENNKKIMEIKETLDRMSNPSLNNIRVRENTAEGQNQRLQCLVCGKPHLTIDCWYYPNFQNSNVDHQSKYRRNFNSYRATRSNYRNNFAQRQYLNTDERETRAGQNSNHSNRSQAYKSRVYNRNGSNRRHPYRGGNLN